MGTVRLCIDAIQLALGLVFLVSSTGKLRAWTEFARGVDDFHVVPHRLAVVGGWSIPPLELMVGAALVFDSWAVIAALTSVGLLISFSVVIAVNLRRHRVLPCYCFGTGKAELISDRSLARMSLILGGALVVIVGTAAGVAETSSSGDTFYVDQRLIDGLLRMALAVFVVVAGLWILAVPELVRPWRQMLRRTR